MAIGRGQKLNTTTTSVVGRGQRLGLTAPATPEPIKKPSVLNKVATTAVKAAANVLPQAPLVKAAVQILAPKVKTAVATPSLTKTVVQAGAKGARAAATELITSPKSVAKELPKAAGTVAKETGKFALNLPNYVIAGFVGVGRSALEEILPKVYPHVTKESLRKDYTLSKASDEYLLKGQVKTWQNVKDDIDKYSSESPLASTWEKKNLGSVLAITGFLADVWPGGGGKGKLPNAVLKTLAEQMDETAIRREMQKLNIPTPVIDKAAAGVASARTPEAVEQALKDAARASLDEVPPKPKITGRAQKQATAADIEATVRPPLEQKGIPEPAIPKVRATSADVRQTAEKAPKLTPDTTKLTPNAPQVIPKELESLATEARKYKSADEFVDSQPIFYHRTKEVFDQFDSSRDPDGVGIWFAKSKDVIDDTAKEYPILMERFPKKNLKLISEDELSDLEKTDAYLDSDLNTAQFLTKEGWDGIDYGDSVQLFDPEKSTYTKSQLTDIYNQAPEKLPKSSRIEQPEGKRRANTKLEDRVNQAASFDEFAQKSGLTPEALEATAKSKGFATAREYFNDIKSKEPEAPKPIPISEDESLEFSARQQESSDYALRVSEREDEIITSNLEAVFADMKGVDVEDLKVKFTDDELEQMQMNYSFAYEALMDDPARALAKYESKAGEFKGTLSEVGATDGKGSKWAVSGDDIAKTLGFEDSETARARYTDYKKRRQEIIEWEQQLKEIRHSIRLAKQKDAFIGKEKARLARELATNRTALNNIVRAAERAGFRRGQSSAKGQYNELITRLKTRRRDLSKIQHKYNLSDQEMKRATGSKDPRFMTKEEFGRYITGVEYAAVAISQRRKARLLAESIIEKKDLKKADNLRKAMQLPRLENMTYRQAVTFIQVLQRTEAGDTFLGPRMIQTVKNTDLGNIRTVGEAKAKIIETTGMKADPVDVNTKSGFTVENLLRDPTLAERDPLHKLFITEYAAKEADMLTRKYVFRQKIEELATKARKSRRIRDKELRSTGKLKQNLRDRVLARFAPQDKLVTKWLQPFRVEYDDAGKRTIIRDDTIRTSAEAAMTPDELEYAKFLQKFFQHYYNLAADESMQRWTLQGVKHTNYRDIYYTHMPRGFFERWRDNGFLKAFKLFWAKNTQDQGVDFNAFGDRGEVLGLEKWLTRNMTREGEGIDKKTGEVFYTRNTAKVAAAYFHAFERKILLDSLIPKVKLYEFLLGARKQTPKSIANPEGTEKINSALTNHINRWINNKKGQKSTLFFEQGSRAENVVDGLKLWISMQHLGVNLIAQVTSGIGGEVLTFAGAGVTGWAKGHRRALTKQGRQLARANAGVIGDPPWSELANAANEVGDTLRSGVFYIFGDLSYRARRQMFLGLLTPEEFKTGNFTQKRLGEIKLQLGRWHQMPEFRSLRGNTSEVKAIGMYTEWALPVIQTTYYVNLPRVINMLRSAKTTPERLAVAKTKEFQELFRTVLAGAGMASLGYLVLNPDENDKSNLGYLRNKAAQEISSLIQAATFWGLPIPGTVMLGYLEQMKTAIGLILSRERYEKSGEGYKAGDLKATKAIYRLVVPSGVRRAREMIYGEPEVPPRTKEDIRIELKEKLDSGEMSMSAAGPWLKKELAALAEQEMERRLEMKVDDYRADVKARIESEELSMEDAGKEIKKYLENQKKYAPETFESTNDANFIKKIQILAKALGTDPVTAFQAVFTGEEIRRMDNGAIILHRGKTADPVKQKEFALEERKARGANADLILDHTIPLQLGGDNSDSNLQLVPKDDWKNFTPVENYLGQALRNGDLTEKEARRLILEFKNGRLDAESLYKIVEGKD